MFIFGWVRNLIKKNIKTENGYPNVHITSQYKIYYYYKHWHVHTRETFMYVRIYHKIFNLHDVSHVCKTFVLNSF